MTGILPRVARFFGSYRFPIFAISLLASFHLALALALVVPADAGGRVGALVEGMRVWCFGYDASTGSYQMGYVGMIVVEPLVLGAGIALFWWGPVRDVLRTRPLATLPWVGSALSVVALAVVTAVATQPEKTPEAPLSSIRTEIPAPEFRLVTQSGRELSSAELRGRVTLLTGVYATCGATCPMILGQAKRALAALSPDERDGVVVVAVTMDPEHDTPSVLAELARGQKVGEPHFELLTGAPPDVDTLLDKIGVIHHRDPVTGVIDHTNVFSLVDRRGRIAYRFSLGETQERWLVAAMKSLVAEAPGGA